MNLLIEESCSGEEREKVIKETFGKNTENKTHTNEGNEHSIIIITYKLLILLCSVASRLLYTFLRRATRCE